MDISITSLLAFLIGLVALYLIGILLVVPIRFIIKLVLNAVAGGILLLIFNFIAGIFGLNIVINPLSALIVGVLGIPGVILLLILQIIL